MSDFNSDCKVSGCEREAVDSSGLCSKHKTDSDKSSVSASVEQIAREAAQDIADSNSQIKPSEYDYQTILAAIAAALAPVVAELAREREVTDGLGKLNDKLQAELEQAKLDLLHLENLLNGEDAPKVDGLNIPLPLSSRFYNWMTKTTAELEQAKELAACRLQQYEGALKNAETILTRAQGYKARLATAEAKLKAMRDHIWLMHCKLYPDSPFTREQLDAAQAKGAQQPCVAPPP